VSLFSCACERMQVQRTEFVVWVVCGSFELQPAVRNWDLCAQSCPKFELNLDSHMLK
jgi:hypothetical protein